MLRVTVDINGREIGRVAAVRTEDQILEQNTYEIYDVTTVSAGESVVKTGEKLGEVDHAYTDGAATLIQLVMEEIGTLPS